MGKLNASDKAQRRSARRLLLAGLLAHLPHLALAIMLGGAAMVLLDETDERLSRDVDLLVEVWVTLLPYFLAVSGVLLLQRSWSRQWLAQPMPFPGSALIRRHWREILRVRIPLAIGLCVTTSYFYFTFKVNIPVFTDFTLDHVFVAIDRALFFGRDAWQITHAVLPWTLATRFLDAIYLAWYLVLFATILVVGAAPLRHPLRLTFLLAIGLNWVIGGVLIATLLPAAGPVYLERIAGDPSFVPLIERLQAQAAQGRIVALEIQEWLWAGYTDKSVDAAGISAFPSLHVAIPATCAMLAMAADRVVGWLLWIFTLTVLVGSVHLGWHYAVDGIGGLLLAFGCWRLSQRVVAWWLRRIDAFMAEREVTADSPTR
jgi:membrane-associated phospholipid phosphatase